MKLAWPQALTDEEHGKVVEALRTESNTKASTIAFDTTSGSLLHECAR
jgi:hypothetical protein